MPSVDDSHDDLSRSAAGDRNPWLVAVVISIATFMQVLDTSIANVALRNIAGSLAAGVDESTWVITSYLVASAVVLPISGWLSGVVGRKRFYMICVATFTIASVMCAFAPTLGMLIVFRVLQGLGGGGMAPSEQAMLADTFPARRRAQAFALYGVAVIVAPTIGPTLGGWLTDNYSWHWIFLINGPIGLLSLTLVHWLVDEPEVLQQERRERVASGIRVDWIGFLLVALCLGCLEVVLDKGEREDWFQSNFIISFFAVSIAALIAFIPWELSRDDPIVDIRLFGRRQFATANILMLALGAILFGTTQLIPQLLQVSFGYTATLSGFALMPGGLAMLLMMPVVGFVSGYVAPKWLIGLGMATVALSMWHLMSLEPGADFSFMAWARVYQTIGLPFLFIPITSASYAGLPADKSSEASSLINVSRNLGGSIGVSVAGTVLAEHAQVHQAYLTANLVPSSPAFQAAVQHATATLIAQGVPAAGAARRAYALIEQTVNQQATLLAYDDVFLYYAWLAAILVPIAFILLRPGEGRAPAGAH
ncbi:MAG TPA: DHA2 family efflux MFS transporter permease subunit [Xanthobacteraceae bacterium]|nr:DHA2 family efflux MFS transporter permease subunit [Xanthobacteraceae bacterium]